MSIHLHSVKATMAFPSKNTEQGSAASCEVAVEKLNKLQQDTLPPDLTWKGSWTAGVWYKKLNENSQRANNKSSRNTQACWLLLFNMITAEPPLPCNHFIMNIVLYNLQFLNAIADKLEVVYSGAVVAALSDH